MANRFLYWVNTSVARSTETRLAVFDVPGRMGFFTLGFVATLLGALAVEHVGASEGAGVEAADGVGAADGGIPWLIAAHIGPELPSLGAGVGALDTEAIEGGFGPLSFGAGVMALGVGTVWVG